MIIGEGNRPQDIVVNICKTKKLTNMRSATADVMVTLQASKNMSLEESLEYIAEDELVEVTPNNIRMRKKILNTELRKKQDAKKRFTAINYLKLYDRIFKKDKHIILKTDNKILFASSMENLSQYWYSFKKVSMDLHNDERKIENVMTDFEKQYFKEKRPIYYVDASFKN